MQSPDTPDQNHAPWYVAICDKDDAELERQILNQEFPLDEVLFLSFF